MRALYDTSKAAKPILEEDADALLRLEKLDEIESHGNTRNPKIAIMSEHSDLLRDVFRLAYDWQLTYGVRKLPRIPKKGRPVTAGVHQRWSNFLDLLGDLSVRKLTGSKADDAIVRFWRTCSTIELKWYSRIIRRDLCVKVARGTIEKVWPGLIESWGVQLAPSSPIEPEELRHLQYPVYVEPKYDGVRVTVIVDVEGTAVLRTRSGKAYFQFKHITDELARLGPGLYDGEAFASRWNDTAGVFHLDPDRPGAMERILGLKFLWFDYVLILQDAVPPLRARRIMMKRKLQRTPLGCVVSVPMYRVETPEQVIRLYRRFLSQGHEGCMVKTTDGIWQPGRTTDWLKVKAVKTVDAEIIATVPHRKNADMLGAFVVEYQGRHLKVGGGFTHKMRRDYWRDRDDMIGRVIEFKHQEDPSQVALGRFCVFKRFRFDKTSK